MRIICAWCDCYLGWQEGKVRGNTHGICQKCLKEMLEKRLRRKQNDEILLPQKELPDKMAES